MEIRKIIAAILAAGTVLTTLGNDLIGDSFQAEEVVVSGAGATLGGTLTRPAGELKGALVLASGSGAQDRDEEVSGHRPFRAVAEYLAGRGYAVLRMDDRGVGASGGDASAMTVADYAADLSAALAKLDSVLSPEIPKGVLGHSEGGNAAVKAAVSDPGCRFIVTLAAPAWPGDSIVMSQARAMATAMSGKWDGEATQRRLMDLVKSPLPTMALAPMLYSEIAGILGDAASLPQVREQVSRQVEVLTSPASRSMLRYDPADDMRRVAVPWLALNGDRDLQVLPANLSTISSLNSSAEMVLLPGHNHLFLKCATGLVQEYASLPGDISEETLAVIGDWLDRLSASWSE